VVEIYSKPHTDDSDFSWQTDTLVAEFKSTSSNTTHQHPKGKNFRYDASNDNACLYSNRVYGLLVETLSGHSLIDVVIQIELEEI